MTFHVRAFNPSDPLRDFRFTFPEEVVPQIDTKDEERSRLLYRNDTADSITWEVQLKWERKPETLPFEQAMFTRVWNHTEDVILLEDDFMVVGFPNLCPTFRTYFGYVRTPENRIHLFKETELAEIKWLNVQRASLLHKPRYHKERVSDPDPSIQYTKDVLKGLGLEETSP